MSSGLQVRSMLWEEEFLPWFRKAWKPGQHLCLVGPTGVGKTTHMVGILPLRNYVIALDPKGGDDTLGSLEKAGFERVKWPLKRKHWKAIEEGKPARFIIGSNVDTVDDLPRLRREMALALRDAFNHRGWTVYVDELQIVSDRRQMNLSASVERNLIAARTRGVSMTMGFQQPSWVPPSAARMSTWFLTFYTRDREVVTRLSEMAGRPAAEMRGMINGLPEYCSLLFSRNPREPVIVLYPSEAK